MTAPVAAPRPVPPASAPSVHVRMYRALKEGGDGCKGMLGDCFLLRMEHEVEGVAKRETVLIDCGMLRGSPEPAARMEAIAADIVEQTGGDLASGRPGELDLLVVTHQHWDHLSGFAQARHILLDPNRLRIRNLWLAWTEDDGRADVKALRERFDGDSLKFAAIAGRLRDEGARFGADAADLALGGLDGFLGLAGKDGRLSTREILEELKGSLAASAKPSYLEPGEARATPGAIGLNTFVLGPPTDWTRLFKDRPSAGPGRETYFDDPDADGAQLEKFAGGTDPEPKVDSPFAVQYCRIGAGDLATPPASGPSPSGGSREWLRARYHGTAGDAPPTRAALARRRIDGDWLAGAGALALKLDADTNNTSLVLAFELPDGSLMLFPGDAQVGNWLSWHDRTYPDGAGGRLTAEQLLNRVRFYKVGHHGSHNATARERGLAMMTRPDLVAAIPTDEELGRRQGAGGWQMPNPSVAEALRVRAKGRIIRTDRRYSEGECADLFGGRLTDCDLFLEYHVFDPERNPS